MEGMDAIRLTIPATKSMLLVVRMTTAGVLARMGLTVDDLEDMKMAVEEACGYLSAQEECKQLLLEYALSEGEIRIVVSTPEGAVGVEEKTIEVMQCLLASLASSAQIHAQGNRISSIELRKRLGR